MSDISLKINLKPVGDDRFAIVISGNNRSINKEIYGPDPDGFTETDLRSVNGLPKCGLNQDQIDKAISNANKKRKVDGDVT